MEQYSIKKFAESLESLPRALAENSGVKVKLETVVLVSQECLHMYMGVSPQFQAMEVISKLYTSHQAGEVNSGFDIEGDGAAVKDVAAAGIWDLYLAKYWGIKLATNVAATVLRVDQVSDNFKRVISGGGDFLKTPDKPYYSTIVSSLERTSGKASGHEVETTIVPCITIQLCSSLSYVVSVAYIIPFSPVDNHGQGSWRTETQRQSSQR